MTNHRYTMAHAIATILGLTALGYQTWLVWNTYEHLPLIDKVGIPIASVSAAALPILAEAAWRSKSRFKGFLMVLPALLLLSWILPTTVSRMGEGTTEKRLAAEHRASQFRLAEASVDRAMKRHEETLTKAVAECQTGKGGKCVGSQEAVATATAQLTMAREELAKARPAATAWLPDWHGALLPLGLELAIFTALLYGMAPLVNRMVLSPASDERPSQAEIDEARKFFVPVQSGDEGGETVEDDEDDHGPRRGPATRQQAERELVTMLAMGRKIGSQDELAAHWGVPKGTVSKWMQAWEQDGIVKRSVVGRCKVLEKA